MAWAANDQRDRRVCVGVPGGRDPAHVQRRLIPTGVGNVCNPWRFTPVPHPHSPTSVSLTPARRVVKLSQLYSRRRLGVHGGAQVFGNRSARGASRQLTCRPDRVSASHSHRDDVAVQLHLAYSCNLTDGDGDRLLSPEGKKDIMPNNCESSSNTGTSRGSRWNVFALLVALIGYWLGAVRTETPAGSPREQVPAR